MKKTVAFLVASILAFVPTSADPPDVVEVEPSQGFVDEDTEVTLTGEGFDLGAEVLLAGGGPFRVGLIRLPSHAESVAVAGDYAYVTRYSGGLQVIDVSDPSSPALVGSYGTPYGTGHIAVAGDYAYVIARPDLLVIDVSDPHLPTLAGTYEALSHAQRVAVAGNYAYVLDSHSLHVIDVGNPQAPALAGFYDALEYAYGLVVAGGYAYVGGEALRVLDIRDPGAPTLVASYEPQGDFVVDVAIAGGYAHVAVGSESGYNGLEVIDIRDPQAPVLAGSYATSIDDWWTLDVAWRVVVADNRAYLGLTDLFGFGDRDLFVIDVSDPHDPELTEHYPHYARPVAATEDYVYVVAGRELHVIDISSPQAPAPTGSYKTPRRARGVAVAGDYAYVPDGDLQIVDISDPRHPVLEGSCATPNYSGDVVVVGDYAYVANGDLQIVDVSNSQAPELVGSHDTPGWAWGVAVAGNYAYVADEYHGLRVVDVSDPHAPTFAGVCDTPGWAYGVAVVGDYAYVAQSSSGNRGLQVIDVRDPHVPTLAGNYDLYSSRDVAVVGDYAYVVGADVWIIDVRNPHALRLAGKYDAPCFGWKVAVAGNYAYVAGQSCGLLVVDVGNPHAPALADSYNTPGYAYGVAVGGGHAYVADDRGGLQVIDLNPSLQNVSCLPDTSIQVTVPAGFNPGPYDVRVTNPDGEPNVYHNGFRACERHTLTCDLQSVEGSRSSRSWPGESLRSWRLILEGDDAFFPPQPRHQALLLLPDLPSTLETRFEPGDGSGRMVIRVEVSPESDSAVVRLIGDDPGALDQWWGEVRSAGGVELPRLGPRSYGDLSLTVIPGSVAPIEGQAGTEIHYSYELTHGRLTAAGTSGPGADLVVEILAWDKYRCETVARLSVLEAMAGPTN